MIKVAMLWIENENGAYLLAKRSENKKTEPGLWGPSVTGKVEKGESYIDTTIREAKEELRLNLFAKDLVFILKEKFLHPDGEMRQFMIFHARIDTAKTKITLDMDEVTDVMWLPTSMIRDLIDYQGSMPVVASAHKLWRRIFEQLEAKS